MTEKIQQSDDTLLEFPCEFRVKAMGLMSEDFESIVYHIVKCHCASVTMSDVRSRLGKTGKYVSVTVTIQASNKPQLDNIYSSLSQHDKVTMTL